MDSIKTKIQSKKNEKFIKMGVSSNHKMFIAS